MPQSGETAHRRATLYDVARLAGVSHQTVSQVVKSGPHVRPETRHRVEAAIAQLGYTPNLAARTLATARSHRIGALFFDRYDEVGPTRTMQAAVDYARDHGYVVDVVGVDPHDPSSLGAALELVAQAGVAGVIVFAPTAEVIDAVRALSLAVSVPVIVESEVVSGPEPGTGPTRALGLRLATEYLAELGHERFFHVAGPHTWLPARERTAQYRAVIEERSLRSVGEYEGDWSARSGYLAGLDLPLDSGLTAVVVSNDQMALGVLKALHIRGVRVPEQLSVIGYDDVAESAYFEPALTTISNDFEGQGRLAMDALLQTIDPARPHSELFQRDPVLVVRDSTAPPPV
ncbi:LacI family DNA-binding transcriptional regulator [Galbitalea soli]|uniref:Substrate-binding domain-containing protein n=1 Tax=Galbitalea soli TaxID=1268042 RepID=A0A7C9TR89_9MICO|nr:substrate-binding domain-containing protein [Galbitalea soli]NEM91858.1 substrate-binding domain-containing protein [Galbitalea soli]NYJ29306.1 DNA-binding LacI/PurR family transcriptional regulator [Galbitalea soli]